MNDNTVRLALIGTGGIARHHIRSMAELKSLGLGGFVVCAVCDVNKDAAQETAQMIKEALGDEATVYTDYEKMLAAGGFDATDLCLPHGLHHVIGNACMEAGYDVLCEKPLGITIAASRAMAETADRTGKILSVAVPQRRTPAQRAVHWLLNDSDLIGTPLAYFHHYTRPPRVAPPPSTTPEAVPERVRWRMDRSRSGGGMVMDSGFHYCDSTRYLMGEVDTVYAQCRAIGSGQPISLAEAREDTVMVTLSFKSGAIGSWSWSLAAPGSPTASVKYHCSKGSIEDASENPFRVFHLFERRGMEPDRIELGLVTMSDGNEMSLQELEAAHVASLTDEEREFLFPKGMWDGFTYEIHEFFEVLRGNRAQPEVDGWEGLKSLAVCEAIYESAFCGEPVSVDDVASGKIRAYQAEIDAHWGL